MAFDFSKINNLIKQTDISDVTSESSERPAKLPDGVYLCVISEAKFDDSNADGIDRLKITFTTVEDGTSTIIDETGTPTRVIAKKTANRKIFKTYKLETPEQYKKMCGDILKFEDPTNPGVSCVDKDELQKDGEYLDLAIQSIVLGEYRLFVQLSTTLNQGVPKSEPMTAENSSQWPTPISWKRAKAMGFSLDEE